MTPEEVMALPIYDPMADPRPVKATYLCDWDWVVAVTDSGPGMWVPVEIEGVLMRRHWRVSP